MCVCLFVYKITTHCSLVFVRKKHSEGCVPSKKGLRRLCSFEEGTLARRYFGEKVVHCGKRRSKVYCSHSQKNVFSKKKLVRTTSRTRSSNSLEELLWRRSACGERLRRAPLRSLSLKALFEVASKKHG